MLRKCTQVFFCAITPINRGMENKVESIKNVSNMADIRFDIETTLLLSASS